MLKRFMILGLGLFLCLGTIGCGGGDAELPDNPTPPPADEPTEEGLSKKAPPPPGMVFFR